MALLAFIGRFTVSLNEHKILKSINDMKKITLFFMLFYASVAAFAQWSIEDTPLSAIPTGENDYVVLKEPSNSVTGWSANGYLNSGASDVIAEVNASAIYQFKKVGEQVSAGDETLDVLVLLNVKNGKYLKGNNEYVESINDAFQFTARPAVYKSSVTSDWADYSNAVTLAAANGNLDNHWVFCKKDDKLFIGIVYNPSIADYTDTNFWLVYKATKQEGTYIDVTYHYTTTDGFEFTKQETGCLAPYTPNPSSVAPDFYRVTNFDNTALEADATVEVTCAPDFPMEFTTVDANGFADGTKWYTLYTRGNTANVLYSDGTNLKANGQRSELVANKLFAFERVAGNPYTVRVYCMSEGASRSLRVPNFNNDAAAVWEGAGTDVFRLAKNSSGFALANDGNAALDHNTGNNLMAVWSGSATGAGGQINAVSADGMIRDLAASANGDFVGGTVGPQALLDAIAAYGTSSTVVNLKTMIDALAGGREERTISADKVYQIVFTRGNVVVSNSAAYAAADGTVSQEADSRHVVSVNPDNVQPVAATLWKFIADEANYKIQSVNSDFYMGAVDPIGLVTTAQLNWGRAFALERGSAYSNVWALKDTQVNAAECYINSYYNPGQNDSHEFCYWNSGVSDSGNTVHIVEVTDIPVSITSAGWATLNFPLPLKVSADVKAYYVTEVNADGIYVESIEDVIPAGTPVILSGDEGTYPFEVAANAASVKGNKLVGTTVARKDVTAGTYYGLKAASEGAAFVPYNVTSIPANKALLPASEIPADASAVNALYINFGGSATGIGSASVEQRPAAYYDLNGRIVAYPGKGIYVTSDGRKVFLK